MNLFGMIDSSGTAMQAERMRAEVVAANMANAETTRTASGQPYRRQHVIFAAGVGDRRFASQIGDRLGSSLGAQTTPMAGFKLPMPAVFGDAGALNAQGSALDNETLPPLPLLPGQTPVAPGVHIAGVLEDPAPPLKRYDPGHPDADAEGYVSYPDINPLTEMVDLMGATRAYGLNGSAVQAEKTMISSALEIGR